MAALFSGGKDSTYAVYVAQQWGWDVRYLVTIFPKPESMMFHVPNLHLTPLHAEAMGIEHVTCESDSGEESELKALREVLKGVEVDGVLTGAIASDYQKSRIDGVCHDLSLTSFSPLWRKDPLTILRDIVAAGFEVIVTGVAAEGLGRDWLGRLIDERSVEELEELEKEKGISPSGEGGEIETLVIDGPNFERRICVVDSVVEWNGTSGEMVVRGAELDLQGQ